MKKVIVMCVLLALVVAGSASADFIWKFAASNTANQNAGTAAQWGSYPAAAATANQATTVATAAYAAEVVLADPANPGTSAKTALYGKDFFAGDRSKVYVQVWAREAYAPATIDFRMWLSLNSGVDAAPKPFTVKCVYDPIGSLAGSVLATNVSVATTFSQAAPAKIINIPAYTTTTPLAVGNGYIFELTVPEPGSMLAMLSGLVGLVGFGIRRRK